MIRAVQSPRELTDEEAVALARFRMLSPPSRSFINLTMESLGRRDREEKVPPALRLVSSTKGSR